MDNAILNKLMNLLISLASDVVVPPWGMDNDVEITWLFWGKLSSCMQAVHCGHNLFCRCIDTGVC